MGCKVGVSYADGTKSGVDPSGRAADGSRTLLSVAIGECLQPRSREHRVGSSRILPKHAGSDRIAQALRGSGGRGGGFLRGEAGRNGWSAGAERRRKDHHRLHDRGVAGAGPGRGADRRRSSSRGNRSGETAPGTGAAGSGAARRTFGARKPGPVRRHLQPARRPTGRAQWTRHSRWPGWPTARRIA